MTKELLEELQAEQNRLAEAIAADQKEIMTLKGVIWRHYLSRVPWLKLALLLIILGLCALLPMLPVVPVLILIAPLTWVVIYLTFAIYDHVNPKSEDNYYVL